MISKEFILTAVLTVLGPEAPDNPWPHMGFADLPREGLNGTTDCSAWTAGPRCEVKLDRSHMRDRTRPAMDFFRYTRAENTVIHELCHVKAYYSVVYYGSTDESGAVIPAKYNKAIGSRAEDRAWKKCMRNNNAFIPRGGHPPH